MSTPKARRRTRERGGIERLPSGALRVYVYAGIDPITKRPHYLRAVVPADTPKAWDVAEAKRTEFINQLNEKRHPRTSATVNQLLDKYMATAELAERTRQRYVECIDNHIRPFIGVQKAGSIDADILDSLYAELRRCRDHCTGRKRIDHRTPGKHECDERCHPHVCEPLASWTIRKVHYILSGAFKAGIRWRWVAANPTDQAQPPAPPPSNPKPPTPTEAARILNAASSDPDWIAHLWLAMTTGGRRGELCALRWEDVDLERGTAALTGFKSGGQKRRVALDTESVQVLAEQFERYTGRIEALGLDRDPLAYVFSPRPDHSEPLNAPSVSQRYKRMVTKLGIKTHLHNLRHYSATELIGAGVDVRTVAGRLGHADATTTLKIYAAWLSEFDQRAAKHMIARMPERPTAPAQPTPQYPNEKLAAILRDAIVDGNYPPEKPFPAVKEIAAEHQVSAGTAHRAIEHLKSWGFIDARRGIRAVVTPRDRWPETAEPQGPPAALSTDARSAARQLLDFRLIHNGDIIRKFTAEVDTSLASELRALLTAAIRRSGGDIAEIRDYELEVLRAGEIVTTFIALAG